MTAKHDRLLVLCHGICSTAMQSHPQKGRRRAWWKVAPMARAFHIFWFRIPDSDVTNPTPSFHEENTRGQKIKDGRKKYHKVLLLQ